MDKAPESEIIGIAEAGLMLSVEGQEQIAPWSAITMVEAVLALVDWAGDQRIAVLVIAIMLDADERIFIVAESELLWAPLVSILSQILPGIPSVKIWGAQLAASGKVALYERAGGLQ
ncbi:hypothetical protein [Sphingobium cupriresistens]|uniref:Uncharacterized protein n=1 Tax=Sphingobium cupriresistens TaxID=1132417 RepID=A0A8G1ZDA4_9SPHN|nr:hypothetical protein [Sphingobium cupriresistens]RYM07843.1 hypothetical protein EWH12_18105 [Sphingobium cupriresistens]